MLFLRLQPDDCWSLRFRDLATVVTLMSPPRPVPGRDDLRRLMHRYPDIPRTNRTEDAKRP